MMFNMQLKSTIFLQAAFDSYDHIIFMKSENSSLIQNCKILEAYLRSLCRKVQAWLFHTQVTVTTSFILNLADLSNLLDEGIIQVQFSKVIRKLCCRSLSDSERIICFNNVSHYWNLKWNLPAILVVPMSLHNHENMLPKAASQLKRNWLSSEGQSTGNYPMERLL